MSIAGGLAQALDRGQQAGCGAVQIFLKNQRQWRARPLAETEVEAFRRCWATTGIQAVFAHAAYLINLAAPDDGDWRRAIDALADELERAARLGLPFVVLHPGSHRGRGVAAGVARVAGALDALADRGAGARVRIALENTAGAGGLLGGRAEELGAILGAVRHPERLAVCLDTCHLFAAGYDIRTPAGFRTVLAAFDRAVGLDRVVALHLNDAAAPLGSGRDRHQHIGRGQIGLAAFRFLVNHPRLADRPMVLETPKTGDGDRVNLAILRRLRRPSRGPR
jgi:deoxyribonuclease-4